MPRATLIMSLTDRSTRCAGKKAGILSYASGRSKGCGVVEFKSAADAQRAIEQLTNSELGGRRIFLQDREPKGFSMPRAYSRDLVLSASMATGGGGGQAAKSMAAGVGHAPPAAGISVAAGIGHAPLEAAASTMAADVGQATVSMAADVPHVPPAEDLSPPATVVSTAADAVHVAPAATDARHAHAVPAATKSGQAPSMAPMHAFISKDDEHPHFRGGLALSSFCVHFGHF